MVEQIAPLAGKVALVTGSSRRIGRATALALAQQGADVVVHALSSREEVEGVAAEIRSLGRRAKVLLGDVTDEAEVKRLMGEIKAEFGRLDVLVNNAAIRRHVPFTEMSLHDWREIMTVILDGAFLCSREAIRMMLESGGGAIVNIGGMSAHIGAMHRAHVSAAKAGIVGLTKALAVEFADNNIRVNCVAPGKIGGPRSKTSGEGIAAGGVQPLVGREGEADEAAAAICFLCLPAAGYITGQTLHVNGGMFLA
jgi:3-oxoacyl-[acyl-carrier protein] reductase